MSLTNRIKKRLILWCPSMRYEIVLPNFFAKSNYEMDVCKITNSGIVVEYEIKVSRSDFKNDFTKNQHFFRAGTKSKHDQLRNGELLCNRFFFVVPENMVSLDEVPSYCGLIYFTDNKYGGSLEIIRPAKLLHKRNFNDYKMIATQLAQRCYFMEQKKEYVNQNYNKILKEVYA